MSISPLVYVWKPSWIFLPSCNFFTWLYISQYNSGLLELKLKISVVNILSFYLIYILMNTKREDTLSVALISPSLFSLIQSYTNICIQSKLQSASAAISPGTINCCPQKQSSVRSEAICHKMRLCLHNQQLAVVSWHFYCNLQLPVTNMWQTRLPGAVPQLIGLFLFCIEFGWGWTKLIMVLLIIFFRIGSKSNFENLVFKKKLGGGQGGDPFFCMNLLVGLK